MPDGWLSLILFYKNLTDDMFKKLKFKVSMALCGALVEAHPLADPIVFQSICLTKIQNSVQLKLPRVGSVLNTGDAACNTKI